MGKRPTTLRITNAAEDVPRLIQGSGRTPAGGTWGFALAPHTREGVLLLAPKSGGVVRWDANPARGDAPFMPSKAVKDMSAATGKLRKLAKGPTAEVTPITLNGVWKAHMVCGEKGPVVTMTRPLNNYTTVVVSSAWDDESNKPVWAWTLKRDARWFAKKGSESGQYRTLRGAIGQALAAAEGVVGPACTIKETRRRGSRDAGYKGRRGAVRQAAERGRSATQVEVKPKKARGGRKAAPWRGFPFHTLPAVEVFSKPNQRQLKALERGGFKLKGSAEVFGRLAEPFEGLPAGSLVYSAKGDAEFHVGPVVKGGRITKPEAPKMPAAGGSSTSKGRGASGKPASKPPAAKKAAASSTSVKTWREVVDLIDGVYADGGLPEQLPAKPRRNMAIEVAKALRSGVRHDLIRPNQKLTAKAVAMVLGLRGKARPRSEAAWARLFKGENLLPDLTGRMPAMSKPKSASSKPAASTPAPKPRTAKPAPARARRPKAEPKTRAAKDAVIRDAVTAGVADQIQLLFGAS